MSVRSVYKLDSRHPHRLIVDQVSTSVKQYQDNYRRDQTAKEVQTQFQRSQAYNCASSHLTGAQLRKEMQFVIGGISIALISHAAGEITAYFKGTVSGVFVCLATYGILGTAGIIVLASTE